MNTYIDVANKCNLGKIDTFRFIAYMKLRFSEDEYINCISRKAEEWAERFLNEQEYPYSDLKGLRILKKIDCCENCHERLTTDELLEAVETGLTLGEVACDDCYTDFMRQKGEETKHPDDKI